MKQRFLHVLKALLCWMGSDTELLEQENKALKAELERKQNMLDRQFRLCFALVKIEKLALRTDLKIARNRKGEGFIVQSTTDGSLRACGLTLDEAVIAGKLKH